MTRTGKIVIVAAIVAAAAYGIFAVAHYAGIGRSDQFVTAAVDRGDIEKFVSASCTLNRVPSLETFCAPAVVALSKKYDWLYLAAMLLLSGILRVW